jgi:hypothetical protein
MVSAETVRRLNRPVPGRWLPALALQVGAATVPDRSGAIVPTLFAATFFEPRVPSEIEAEEIEAAEAIDVVPAVAPQRVVTD